MKEAKRQKDENGDKSPIALPYYQMLQEPVKPSFFDWVFWVFLV